MRRMTLDEHGHWASPTVFVFNDPLIVSDEGYYATEIDTREVAPMLGLGRQTAPTVVIEAIVRAVATGRLRPVVTTGAVDMLCPACEREGLIEPGNPLLARWDGRAPVLMLCPTCEPSAN